MSALFLRNEFDVAHANLSSLTRTQLRVLHDYANIAEHSVRDLLQKIFEQVGSHQYSMPLDTPTELSQDKQRILDRLEANIRPYVAT